MENTQILSIVIQNNMSVPIKVQLCLLMSLTYRMTFGCLFEDRCIEVPQVLNLEFSHDYYFTGWHWPSYLF